LEKDAEHWVLHGGCLNEVGNLYGGPEMVARVGEAIKKEMVLERMKKKTRRWKKRLEKVGRTYRIERAQTEARGSSFGEEFQGRKTEGQREEKNSVARSFGYVLIFRCV
jgi:hypothetical protein